MSYQCNNLSCGNGKCVHEELDEKCPNCGYNMVRVKTTGFKFCSNPDTVAGCDYEDESEMTDDARR